MLYNTDKQAHYTSEYIKYCIHEFRTPLKVARGFKKIFLFYIIYINYNILNVYTILPEKLSAYVRA